MNHYRKTAARNPAQQGAFTLIELLIVMAIVGILASLTVGSIGSIGQGHRLTAAGNMTVDVINEARQLATARNTKTMVVLVNEGADTNQILTMMIYSPETATNSGWTQVDQWRRLPEGIALDETEEIDTNHADHLFAAPPASVTVRRNGAEVGFKAAIFLPDGRPLINSTKAQLAILRQDTILGKDQSAKDASNFYRIIVNSATGIPTVRRP